MILLTLLSYWCVEYPSLPHLVMKRIVDVNLTFPTCYHVLHYDVSQI